MYVTCMMNAELFETALHGFEIDVFVHLWSARDMQSV